MRLSITAWILLLNRIYKDLPLLSAVLREWQHPLPSRCPSTNLILTNQQQKSRKGASSPPPA